MKVEKVELVVVDEEDFLRYNRLIANILAQDMEFQELIRKHGDDAFMEACKIVSVYITVCFAQNMLPHPAAEKIRAAFFRNAKSEEVLKQEYYAHVLENMKVDRWH